MQSAKENAFGNAIVPHCEMGKGVWDKVLEKNIKCSPLSQSNTL